jgi:large subunit ribosomal protein L5|uniref:Large ribosomal subunit protein uL5c n=2 Tax=Euglena gracilis TaxID=3039 RepID=RK5_EUGGR|nr:ribosomal protein L5 [Euglena gracilis]P21510.1 RecName: Full=Large ribosomal subunit protein uL5c; AltName: Full=50S ribosomal protein L5, chloroplastic [Euglena gracilis]AKL82374.1 ribosomal protein L5 [Euglena gracilis var. bacillaris]CAA50107.1 50S ribosomal protein L5 [Euglena gracilis]CAA77924.1 ribosomal protein L5 [Euglena gracilis]
MQRLKSFYLETIIPKLKEEFGYVNSYRVPKLKKIVINRGFDESCQNSKILEVLLNELEIISGQKPIISKAKKAIANFKLKEKMPVGMFLTLRSEKMYSFLDRLINLSLPRIRDFQGINKNCFDGSGNFSFGLSEQSMFPEINFDKMIKVQGLNITIVTTAETNQEAFFLLKELGIPFRD